MEKGKDQLNASIEAIKGIGPGSHSFGFAADIQSVKLSAVEFFDAARYYPILFTAVTEGRFMPVALLGLKKDENLFVDVRGTWLAPYIPAYFRYYPFTAAREPAFLKDYDDQVRGDSFCVRQSL